MTRWKEDDASRAQLSAPPHCFQAASASVIDNAQKLFSLLTVAAGPLKVRNSSATLVANSKIVLQDI